MDSCNTALTEQSPYYQDRLLDTILVASSSLILLVTLYCLVSGITTVFMHLYYFPIILLSYRYQKKGVLYSALLSLLYLGMVAYFQYSQAIELLSALLRVISFIGVSGVTAWFSIHLEQKQKEIGIISRFNESIVSNANVWLTVLDPSGKIIVWNKAAEDISGYAAFEVIGNNSIWKKLYPDKDYRKKITSIITMIINTHKYFENFETGIRTKNGEEKLISWNTSVIADGPKSPSRFVAIGTDVTARKRAEEALAVSELRFRRTFETAKDGLLLMEKESWEILKVNPAFTEIIGYPAEEITGKKFEEIGLLKNPDLQNLRQNLADNGFAFFPDVPIETRNGQQIDTEMYLVDRTMQMQCNVRDITARKLAENEIIRKNEELRAAYEQLTAAEQELRINYNDLTQSQQALSQARRKLSILNSVTFEDIRNAIFSLNGYLELNESLTQDDTHIEYIKKEKAIVHNIEKTLDFTKNYQHMGINLPQWQNVNLIFLYAISHMPPLKVSRNIELNDLEIYADPLLELALFNIVENVALHSVRATKFAIYYRESFSGLLLFMEDDGEGIPFSEKESIFSRGYGKNRGMGLFITREILEITGIRIKETGEPGKGARFEILIPTDKFRFGGISQDESPS